jgi:hypothetical protein
MHKLIDAETYDITSADLDAASDVSTYTFDCQRQHHGSATVPVSELRVKAAEGLRRITSKRPRRTADASHRHGAPTSALLAVRMNSA